MQCTAFVQMNELNCWFIYILHNVQACCQSLLHSLHFDRGDDHEPPHCGTVSAVGKMNQNFASYFNRRFSVPRREQPNKTSEPTITIYLAHQLNLKNLPQSLLHVMMQINLNFAIMLDCAQKSKFTPKIALKMGS